MLGTYSKYMNFTEEDPKCERVSGYFTEFQLCHNIGIEFFINTS